MANSFRFVDGYYIDGADTETAPEDIGISTLSIDFSKGGNTWTKNGDAYSATGTDGSTGMTVTGAKGFGIDVSSWQNSIDWAAVKRSGIVDYAIIRCGWGDDMRSQDDRQFLNNVRGCLNNGIPFGIYIYSYAYDTSMAQSEANHVLRLLKEVGLNPSKVAYPIYLDLEQQDQSGRPAGMNDGKFHTVSNQMLEQIAATFCTSIENAGYSAGVYANKNWWTNYLTGASFGNWSKWVAQYNTTCTYSGSYDMWQYTSSGTVSGVSGRVDISCFSDQFYNKELSTTIPDVLKEKLDAQGLRFQEGYISGFALGSNLSTLAASLSSLGAVTCTNASGNIISSAKVASGQTVSVVIEENGEPMTYTMQVVIRGDLNGDGNIGATDLYKLKLHIIHKELLSGAFLQAAKLANDSAGATSLLKIKNDIIGKEKIKQ